jgi:PAS domain S-box-containing protein
MQPELVTNEHPEGALRESRWFRAIFENATDGIMIAEVESRRMLFGNAAICWMLGRRPEEIKGLTLRDIHPETFLAYAERDFARHIEDQGGRSENVPMKRKDGSIFYADITVAPVEIGAKHYLAGFFRDITERKLAEQLVRDREADFTAIVEHSPIAMLVSVGGGADDRIMAMNQAASDMLGYTLDDIPDLRHWWTRAYPDEKYREEVRAEWTRRTASAIERMGRIEPMETTVTCKDGTTRYVRFSFASIGDRHILTGEDLTARRHAETALRESEARYRNIFNAAYDVIYTIEPDGTLSSISPSAERMTGWRPEEWIGKHFAPVVHPDDQSRVQVVLDRLFAGETYPGAEIRIVTKSGAYLDTEFTAAMHHRDGSPVVVGVLRDISARKRAEEQVRKLNEGLERTVRERTRALLDAQQELVRSERLSMLGQVAGSVGHELRNPLGVMSNAVYFLKSVLTDADDITREYLDIIQSEIMDADRIVEDLLDSVRVKPPHPETVSLAPLLEQSLAKCAIPESVTVRLEIPEEIPPLWVDAMQMMQVFRNLISNGVEAMPGGGVLVVRAVTDKGEKRVTIHVTDSGSGMTPEHREKLFQPLYTTKARGIGLGLSVVKNLAEANGGRVEVESEPGLGSTFSVSMPAGGTGAEQQGSAA